MLAMCYAKETSRRGSGQRPRCAPSASRSRTSIGLAVHRLADRIRSLLTPGAGTIGVHDFTTLSDGKPPTRYRSHGRLPAADCGSSSDTSGRGQPGGTRATAIDACIPAGPRQRDRIPSRGPARSSMRPHLTRQEGFTAGFMPDDEAERISARACGAGYTASPPEGQVRSLETSSA